MTNPDCSPATKPRILIVEDDESVRTMIGVALGRAGYHVDKASDGVEGLALLRTHPYDLLITDHRMPRLTGLEMLQELHTENIRLPIILASGTMQPNDVDNLSLPPFTILTKPFVLAEMLALVKSLTAPHNPGTLPTSS